MTTAEQYEQAAKQAAEISKELKAIAAKIEADELTGHEGGLFAFRDLPTIFTETLGYLQNFNASN